MAFAPFPPPVYLSDGARTEGEMKTAFENWLLATKQTSGHGQCRLVYGSPTQLILQPVDGRRVLVNDRAYELPVSGLGVTNAVAGAGVPHLVVLSEDGAGVVSLNLHYLAAAGGAIRVVDPDSGISMISFDNGASIVRSATVVGLAYTNGSAQFTEAGVCSLYNRRLQMLVAVLPSPVSGSSTTAHYILGLQVAAFAGDTVHYQGQLAVEAPSGGALVQTSGAALTGTTGGNYSIVSFAASAYNTVLLNWALHADADGAVEGQLGYLLYGGGPITITIGTRVTATRLG